MMKKKKTAKKIVKKKIKKSKKKIIRKSAAKKPVPKIARTIPQAGALAPNFTLTDHVGNQVSLSTFRGKHVILYFYPKDDTSGCTKEACGFRDDYEIYRNKGIEVIGISRDDEISHTKFIEKYNLPFRLLSDPGAEVIRKYGAWGTKNMYGRIYQGIIRSTFLIDPEGKIKQVFPKVSPEGHSKEILEIYRG
jgi:peroxiredoxin Q/BCP